MIEITHKETNKRIDNLNLDSVLNVDSLKKVGDNIDNILLETWKEQPQYFVYDGGDGEIPLKNLGTIREEVGDVEAFISEDGNRIGNGRLQTTMVSHHKIPTKLPRISKILFDLFGYDMYLIGVYMLQLASILTVISFFYYVKNSWDVIIK